MWSFKIPYHFSHSVSQHLQNDQCMLPSVSDNIQVKNQHQKDERFVGYDVLEYGKSWEWAVHSSLQPSFKEHLLGLGIV